MSARPNPNPPSPLEAFGRTTPTVARLALSVDEACSALGVSWDTWREYVEHEVRVVRVGRRKLIAVAELERWLAANAERALERR
jgi:excisionase family DNA binding protein